MKNVIVKRIRFHAPSSFIRAGWGEWEFFSHSSGFFLTWCQPLYKWTNVPREQNCRLCATECGPWILQLCDVFSERLLLVLNVKLWALHLAPKIPRAAYIVCGPIRGIMIIKPKLIGHYLAGLVFKIYMIPLTDKLKTKMRHLVSGYKLLQRAIKFSYLW